MFPISNWTELDVWQYIHLQNIPIPELYFAAERPVVERDGTLIMVDDERMRLHPGETPMMKSVRFRTLGCYPLTGAVESTAATLPQIIQEMLLTTTSERQGPGDRPRRLRLDGEEEAGGLFLMTAVDVNAYRPSELIAADIDAYLRSHRDQVLAALHHLRLGGRRQVHP